MLEAVGDERRRNKAQPVAFLRPRRSTPLNCLHHAAAVRGTASHSPELIPHRLEHPGGGTPATRR